MSWNLDTKFDLEVESEFRHKNELEFRQQIWLEIRHENELEFRH